MSSRKVNWSHGGASTGDYQFGSGEMPTIVEGSPPDRPFSNLNINGVVTMVGGGVATIINNLNISTPLYLENGTSINIEGSLQGSPNGVIYVGNGSSLSYKSTLNVTTIRFNDQGSGPGGVVNISGQNANATNVIQNLSDNDRIHFNGWGWNTRISFEDTGSYDSSGKKIYRILDQNHDSTPLVSSVTLADGASPSDFYWDQATNTIVCFLKGAWIETPRGLQTVETLQEGDDILTFDAASGVSQAEPIIWTGNMQVTVDPALPDDVAGWPVCVRKDALSDGIPSKDLYVTAEHCLFLAGHLIPSRMLVNGSSIYFDKSKTSYTCYHLETAAHAVIRANHVLTETYLDDGNRHHFDHTSDTLRTASTVQCQQRIRTRPFNTSQAFVEPLYRALLRRCDIDDTALISARKRTGITNDLHLRTAAGTRIEPFRYANSHALFRVHAVSPPLRLVSQAFRPCDMIGPYVDDRRRLGVCVGDITLYSGLENRNIDAHRLVTGKGWHDLDHPIWRWTNGNAELDLGDLDDSVVYVLAIKLLDDSAVKNVPDNDIDSARCTMTASSYL